MHDGAVGVTEDLNLDVARALEKPFEEHGLITEERLRLALCRDDRCRQVVGRFDETDAASAAAGACLHQKRVSDAVGEFDEIA
jgi:hypothetical protein